MAMLTTLAAMPFAGPVAGNPTPTIPGVRPTVIDCAVTAEHLTTNCRYPPSIYWKPGPRDLAIIADVTAHPEFLADAAPGADVEVVVRRIPEGRPSPASSTQPLDWAPPAPAGASPLITDPNWISMLSDHDLNQSYPERAVRMAISGDATATCTIATSGDLVGCWLSSENPADQGFGHSLLVSSTFLKIDALTRSGAPSSGRAIKIGAHYTILRRVTATSSGVFAVQLVVLTN